MTARRRRLMRALALAGAAAVIAGTVLLGADPASVAAARTATPTPSSTSSATSTATPTATASPTPSPTASGKRHPRHPKHGVTVRGPHLWNPATQKPLAQASEVTVSQTTHLVNQMVQVSWTHFTPSSTVLYDAAATNYPVMVAECRGTRPTQWSQCYGADNGGVEGAFGPFGPMNTAYSTSAPDGTGALDIQILTAAENQQLGCTRAAPCSLVIVPAQGGNVFASPVNCKDHSQDDGQAAIGQVAFSSGSGSCSWKDRIIVPLKFAPSPTGCALRNANFSVIGSPMLARAMDSWRSQLCSASNPLNIQYNSQIAEPQAVSDAQNGIADVALTTRPASTPGNGKHSYVYAPVAISATSVAYWVDSPVTGQPATSLKLDPRLLLKLLTQSYDFQAEGCGHGKPPPTIGCDGAVDGNPVNLFSDPEFKQLNPHVPAPSGYGLSFQVPTVESGDSDMTWTVTSWIAGDKGANSFLHGTFDRWGMHVNTDYLGLSYPVASFTGQDSYPVIAHKYNPVFPLNLVASYQAEDWEPGTDWEKDQFGNYPKDPIQVPGERGLFAILDQADAAAYLFPVAALRNATGRYVRPTNAAMYAAVRDMAPSQHGLPQQANLTRKDPAAYPLTMIVYAMVPVSGVKSAKAASIADFLDYVAGAGQTRGLNPGQLPPGFAPLTAPLRAVTLRDATEVRNQSGPAPPGSHLPTTPAPAAAGLSSPSASPGRAASLPPPNAVPTASQRIALVAAHAAPAGFARYAVPLLLIVGGLAALGGSSSLFFGANGAAINARLRRMRQLGLTGLAGEIVQRGSSAASRPLGRIRLPRRRP